MFFSMHSIHYGPVHLTIYILIWEYKDIVTEIYSDIRKDGVSLVILCEAAGHQTYSAPNQWWQAEEQ